MRLIYFVWILRYAQYDEWGGRRFALRADFILDSANPPKIVLFALAFPFVWIVWICRVVMILKVHRLMP